MPFGRYKNAYFHNKYQKSEFIVKTPTQPNLTLPNDFRPPTTTTTRTEQNRMRWLGLSASVLAGGVAGFPQLIPGPGQPEEDRDLTAL